MSQDNEIKNLRSLQEICIGLISFFTEVCKKENLTYYMIGGTMLGAVRHKGFIPWDDDADFGMPRADYEKFFSVVDQYLPPYYKQITYLETKGHPYYAAQLVDIRAGLQVDSATKGRDWYVWIDIFPLDGMPNFFLLRKIHKVWLLYQRMMFVMSNLDEGVFIHRTQRPWYEKTLIWFAHLFSIERKLSGEKRFRKLNQSLKRFPYDKSNYLINMMGAAKFKEMFSKDIFGKGRLYEFESLLLNGPQDYKTYLAQMYGDYMTPPPMNERKQHYLSGLKEEDIFSTKNKIKTD